MESNELTSTPIFDKKMEIQKRLQSEEAQKARKLLETAMSHLEAHRVMRSSIIKKLNGNGKVK